MLRTESRPKLPKFAAWPTTTARLIRTTEGTGRAASATLHYSDYNVTWIVSNPASRLRPNKIVEVRFTKQWVPEGEWSIRVNPVPAERATRVRALVEEEMLSRLRLWLERTPEPAATATFPTLTFVCSYNEPEDVLEYDEA
jgi:hypothetical protein